MHYNIHNIHIIKKIDQKNYVETYSNVVSFSRSVDCGQWRWSGDKILKLSDFIRDEFLYVYISYILLEVNVG